MKLTPPGDIRERVDDISKKFTGAGWKNLPQELVDEVLGHLLHELNALKACSLTCKSLFGATRPIIHQRVCLTPRPARMDNTKPEGSPSSLRRNVSAALEPLVDADRSGLLRYVQYLTFKIGDGSFTPENMQTYLPHLQSITNLHTLTLKPFLVHLFRPVFNKCFGMFTNTLRHLDIRKPHGTDQQLLFIISQFPLLEDLTIVSPIVAAVYPRDPLPVITRSPPLRGTLVLVQTDSRGLPDGLAALPGGPHCRSLELFRCQGSQVVLDACSHTVTSVSYMWCAPDGGSSSCVRVCVLRCNLWYYRDPTGPRAKRGTRKIRIHRRVVLCLENARVDPPYARNDDLTRVQQVRDLDPAHGVSVEFAIFDEC